MPSAAKSKYAHQSTAAPANAIATAVAKVASRSSSAAPAPIATIDSPSAMITKSAYRSAKCAGETRNPVPRSSSARR